MHIKDKRNRVSAVWCPTIERSVLCTEFGSLVIRPSCITALGKGVARMKALSPEMRELDTTRLLAQKLAL